MDKRNLHKNAVNFSQREFDDEIDKVTTGKERNPLHINNPKSYSNGSRVDKPNVNMVDNFNIYQRDCTSDSIVKERCLNSTFSRQEISSLDEIANASFPCTTSRMVKNICRNSYGPPSMVYHDSFNASSSRINSRQQGMN